MALGVWLVLRGHFTPSRLASSVEATEEKEEEEFCDRRILARIHRATLGRLRKEIAPVSPAEFVRFLFQWQHVETASKLQGEGGLLDVIELLQGFESAAGAFESEILASRIVDYKPRYLDRLCLGGEAVWGRFSRRRDGSYVPSDVAKKADVA